MSSQVVPAMGRAGDAFFDYDKIEFIQISEDMGRRKLKYLNRGDAINSVMYLEPEYENYNGIVINSITLMQGGMRRDFKSKCTASELEALKRLLIENIKLGEMVDGLPIYKLNEYKKLENSVIVNAGISGFDDFAIMLDGNESHIFGINVYLSLGSDSSEFNYIEYGISDINGSRFETIAISDEVGRWFNNKFSGGLNG